MIRRTLVRSAARAVVLALTPERRAFARALAEPGLAQDAVLRRIVGGLAGTAYGRTHGLEPGDEYIAFRSKLPVVTYDELRPWVERQMREEGPVLAPAPVLFYEKTSGSAGPAKHIPCPAALQRSFDRLFRLWLGDLLTHGPVLETGRAWISVSPRLGPPEVTTGGIPVGLASDLDYLDGPWRWLLERFLVLPRQLGYVQEPDALKRVLAGHLVAGRPEVISVWSPSFLTVLLDWIAQHRDQVLADWRARAILCEGRTFPLGRPVPAIVHALERDPIEWPCVLPDLKLVSCWADGPAAAAAAHLARLLPGVKLQGKGLLATEAPLTVPLTAAAGCVPLLDEVFFEFADDAGGMHRLEALAPGAEYSVVLTQQGGLARYRIGDRVLVTHHFGSTPCLVFVGREGEVSDMVGEKLDERFVRAVFDSLPLGDGHVRTLVPVRGPGGRGRYVLLMDQPPTGAKDLARRLDALLQRAYRYREARLLGQLDPPTVTVLPTAEDRLLDALAARGIQRGAVKLSCLVRDPALGEQVLAWMR